MRHRNKKNSLNVENDHQKAMIRNLVTSIILYEKVKTTAKKAKISAPIVEKLISTVKKKEAREAIREINKVVFDKNASKKLMQELKERYGKKDSGFTRITKVGFRSGDNAPVSLIELV